MESIDEAFSMARLVAGGSTHAGKRFLVRGVISAPQSFA
jgi:hypothetical protein